jgi:hypothetical protein
MRLGSMTSVILLVAVFVLSGCGSQSSSGSPDGTGTTSVKVRTIPTALHLPGQRQQRTGFERQPELQAGPVGTHPSLISAAGAVLHD